MKCHFIEQFTEADERISIYRTGKFTDFCAGRTSLLPKDQGFKLFNVAGAYWLGDEKNQQTSAYLRTSFFRERSRTLICRFFSSPSQYAPAKLNNLNALIFPVEGMCGPRQKSVNLPVR